MVLVENLTHSLTSTGLIVASLTLQKLHALPRLMRTVAWQRGCGLQLLQPKMDLPLLNTVPKCSCGSKLQVPFIGSLGAKFDHK